jgi:S-adenosylmethionine-diacylglycerol 3-amino-3-carboxypropyl transferase
MTLGPRSWLARRLFDAVHRRNLVYNQCWEDPAVDRRALDLDPDDRVLVITSAGCNALDYALTGARVVAVDVNPRQNHLLELKQAGIRALDFESFFVLFGEGGSREARDIYAQLRPALAPASQAFWDREVRLFEAPAGGRSFYYRGSSGLVALALRFWIDHVARVREAVERVLAAASLDEQLEVWARDLRPRLTSEGLLHLVGSASVLSLLGVPAPQREMVGRGEGGFAGFLRRCLDHVMSVALLRENYFWSVYVQGSYTRSSCPEYLKPDNFARLKAGLVERVETFTGTVTDCLARTAQPFTAFVLLDHMDWLATDPRALEEEWAGIRAAASASARIIFRSGGEDASFLPASVARGLRFDRELAERLHRLDRVGTYGSFHIARLVRA